MTKAPVSWRAFGRLWCGLASPSNIIPATALGSGPRQRLPRPDCQTQRSRPWALVQRCVPALHSTSGHRGTNSRSRGHAHSGDWRVPRMRFFVLVRTWRSACSVSLVLFTLLFVSLCAAPTSSPWGEGRGITPPPAFWE